MNPFLVIGEEQGASGSLAARSSAKLAKAGWVETPLSGKIKLFQRARAQLPILVRRDRRAVLIGDVFPSIGSPSAARSLDATLGLSGQATASSLLDKIWGRYVLLHLAGDGALSGVFRDPSGALACAIWSTQEGAVVTSAAGTTVELLPPIEAAIDWDIIAAQLSDPAALALGSAIRGIACVPPGGWRDVATGQDQQLWTPAAFARRPTLDPKNAGDALSAAVDLAVGCLAAARPVAVEVSGGLDSAIVAASLKACGADIRTLSHLALAEIEADERGYAEAVAHKLGADLDLIQLDDLEFKLDDIAENQTGITPSISSFDAPAEHALIALCQERGAKALFTGMGGDGVFWTAPTPLILADRLDRRGVRGLFDATTLDLARWTKMSAPAAVVSAIRALGKQSTSLGFEPPSWAAARPRSMPRHPWVTNLEGLPPGKRLQISAFALVQGSLGVTRRSTAIDLVHPLLSQPVLEACSRTPLDVLVLGSRDRGLARTVFANRLPGLVLDRRSKGDSTQRVAKALANGIEPLRDLLLEGRLVNAGLIDAPRLSALLKEEELARGVDLLAVYRTAAIELWIRNWEVRLATGI
jgi:asparagine synthase (glutamine-hydrolysing)